MHFCTHIIIAGANADWMAVLVQLADLLWQDWFIWPQIWQGFSNLLLLVTMVLLSKTIVTRSNALDVVILP